MVCMIGVLVMVFSITVVMTVFSGVMFVMLCVDAVNFDNIRGFCVCECMGRWD